MDPGEALSRIAYLLETSKAETYKVRAFRKAADAIAGLDNDQLNGLAAGGGLKRIEGVGDTTAQVILDALRGGTPKYLAELEAKQTTPADTGPVAEVRRLLKGDCHSHSLWSDGGSPISEMANAAKALGHEYLALTDHSPRLTVAHGLNRERLLAQLEEVAALNAELAPFRILTGIEVDILEDGALDQDEDLLSQLDLVVASVHSKLRMESPIMTKRMLRAIESPHTDILGHCTGRLLEGKGRPESTFDSEAIFEACARTETAVEINSRPERRDPPESLLREAVAAGCWFTIDTDAHAPGQLEWQFYGCEQAVQAEVPHDRIVNAWGLKKILEWTKSHAA